MKTRLLVLLGLMLVCAPVYAAVIATEEWETRPGSPWSYSGGQSGSGANVTATPCGGLDSPGSTGVAGSGGNALRMIYPSGSYATSMSGGTAAKGITPITEVYWGHWGCYSAGFVYHPSGQKMDFFILANTSDNITCGFANGNMGCFSQVNWTAQTNTQSARYCNMGGGCSNPTTGVWHWFEWHIILNTPGVYDGTADFWLDGVQKMHHTNMAVRGPGNSAGLGTIQHAGTYGGGGSTISSTQYWDIDHTVYSTTQIGVPGGPPSNTSDVTAPTPPTATSIE